jgi:hypothetical protein
MKHYLSEAACLAAALMLAASPAYAIMKTKECAAIAAFNAKAPSRAAMKILPCRCLEMKERVDRVYSTPPPGFTCGNGFFYDKQCHGGMTCFKEP